MLLSGSLAGWVISEHSALEGLPYHQQADHLGKETFFAMLLYFELVA